MMTKADVWLCRLLRLIAWVAMLAFAAAVMPSYWIEETAEWLGFEPFPESPLTYYLARNLSLLYGFVGVTLLVIIGDYQRYFPLIRKVAVGTIAFGVMQAGVDLQSNMPWWWTTYASINACLGGALIYWFDHRARVAHTANMQERRSA